MLPRVSGYVLAGGESSRMQPEDGARVDKALLPFGGETLLERALRKVEAVCGNAAILGGPSERCERLKAFGRTVVDRMQEAGPMGGVLAALEDANEEWVLVMPVDLPLLPASALEELVAAATDNCKPSVAVMSAQEHYQPLPVVLHRSAAAILAEALERGERKLMPVLRAAAETLCPLGIWVVPVGELTDESTGGIWFTNVNTPDDLRAAEVVAIASNDFARGASE
jgi:molybdopterin-guanine dinucleotide biosynthesis protein A